MASPLVPGGKGAPVPAGENVLRFFKLSKDEKVQFTHFNLSEDDKKSTLESISVWCQSCTTLHQARRFMPGGGVAYAWVWLGVDDIRNARPYPDPGVTVVFPLDVVWDPLLDPVTQIRLMDDGASGHAGIVGLKKPPGGPKLDYNRLRSKLADLANKNLVRADIESVPKIEQAEIEEPAQPD